MKTPETIEQINNRAIYLSPEILNVSNIFMQKTTQYNHYMRLYIYFLSEIMRNNDDDVTVVEFTYNKLSQILGRHNSHFSLAESKEIIHDFREFINADDIKKDMKSTSNLLLKVYYIGKTIEVEVNNKNNVAQRLISNNMHTDNDKQSVNFRFVQMNYKSSSKFYLYFFLLFAGHNTAHVAKITINSIKQMFNLVPRTTSTQICKQVNKAVETLSLSFTCMQVKFTPKIKDKPAFLTFKWSNYNNGTNGSNKTIIRENGTSFINVNNMNNVFFDNWNPKNIHDGRKYIEEIIEYIADFESKNNTQITNYLEVFKTMFNLFEK